MDWEGSEKVNVNVLKDNLVCRMSFLHNDFYRPTTWQGRHFYEWTSLSILIWSGVAVHKLFHPI